MFSLLVLHWGQITQVINKPSGSGDIFRNSVGPVVGSGDNRSIDVSRAVRNVSGSGASRSVGRRSGVSGVSGSGKVG